MSTPTTTQDPRNAPTSGQFQNSGSDGNQYLMGPSVYLYGFLATLVIIFLVSICIAYKGYRTRRILRMRIDEAIANGVFMPGYSERARNAASRERRRREVGEIPILTDVWVEKKHDFEEDWREIMPLGMTALSLKETNKEEEDNVPLLAPTAAPRPSAESTPAPNSRRLMSIFTPASTSSTPEASSQPTGSPAQLPNSSPSILSNLSSVRIGLIIAMPFKASHSPENHNIDTKEISLGYADVPVADISKP